MIIIIWWSFLFLSWIIIDSLKECISLPPATHISYSQNYPRYIHIHLKKQLSSFWFFYICSNNPKKHFNSLKKSKLFKIASTISITNIITTSQSHYITFIHLVFFKINPNSFLLHPSLIFNIFIHHWFLTCIQPKSSP
ncbi:unnamed protein product [Vicia faba]|uniref:Secreted protein n=1 Tax=Vicia faba TaxID=3906 RepID=A0AAV0Z4P6_VICFA|nr:unnamed protein product [Vicia faba]